MPTHSHLYVDQIPFARTDLFFVAMLLLLALLLSIFLWLPAIVHVLNYSLCFPAFLNCAMYTVYFAPILLQ